MMAFIEDVAGSCENSIFRYKNSSANIETSVFSEECECPDRTMQQLSQFLILNLRRWITDKQPLVVLHCFWISHFIIINKAKH